MIFLEYPIMSPEFEVKPFEKMNKKEAQMHFSWYINKIPERIELLRMAYFKTGGGDKENLDFSPQSLIELWRWFINIIETVPKSEEKIAEEIQQVPNWLKDTVYENAIELSLGSQIILMDIAIYFAEVFEENFDNIQWGVITKPKSLAYVNRPVLIGFSSGLEMDPRILLSNLALEIIDGNNDIKELFSLYEVWTDDI